MLSRARGLGEARPSVLAIVFGVSGPMAAGIACGIVAVVGIGLKPVER
jgi:hypothetical protein